MTKSQTRKKALLASFLSMMLCIAMLAGTTFAWFTDSASNTGNRIQAGNLDVEMYYQNAVTEDDWRDIEAENAKPLFVDQNGDDMLWEPGAVSVTRFKVANAGSLALKYLFKMIVADQNSVTVGGQTYSLANVLKVAVLPGAQTPTRDEAIAATAGNLQSFDAFTDADELAVEEEKDFTVVVYWAPSAIDDNLNLKNGAIAHEQGGANSDPNELHIEIDVELRATQATVENDSFGPLYDFDASIDEDGFSIPKITNFTAKAEVAISADQKTAAETTIANPVDSVKVTIPAGVKTTNNASATAAPLTLVVENGEEEAADLNITAGEGRSIAAYNISIEEVAEDNTQPISVDIFIGKGLVVDKVYHDGTPMAADDWSYNGDTGYLTILTTGFSNFAVELAPRVATIGGKEYVTLQEAFDAAAKDDVITLTKDFTLTKQVSILTNLDGITLDGAGHTIKLATTTDPAQSGGSGLYFGNASQSKWCTGVKIKNLNMTGTARFAIFLCGGSSSVLENVNISGEYLYSLNLYGTHGATMSNCHISNSFRKGTDNEDGAAIWSNVSRANPMVLTNGTKVGTVGINQYASANTKAPKIFIDGTSSIERIMSYEDGKDGDDIKLCVNPDDISRVESFYYYSDDMLFDADAETSTEVCVYNAAGLTAALANNAYTTIKLYNDITTNTAFEINRPVTIDGYGYTIDGSAVPSGFYSKLLHVTASNVKLENLTIIGGGGDTMSSSVLIEKPSDNTAIENFVAKSCHISGGFRGILVESCQANVTVDDCDISADCYAINYDTKSAGCVLTVKNSYLHGWTSYGTTTTASFENVSFTKGTYPRSYGYNVLAAYNDTTLIDCTFGEDFEAYDQTAPNGSFNWTFTNCNKNSTAVTANNFKTLFVTSKTAQIWTYCNCTVDGTTISHD